MQEKGVEGKNKIKERFNELAQQVTIDTSEFMKALLKKKELKRLNVGDASMEESKDRQSVKEENIDPLDKIDVGRITEPDEDTENEILAGIDKPSLSKAKSLQQEARVEICSTKSTKSIYE